MSCLQCLSVQIQSPSITQGKHYNKKRSTQQNSLCSLESAAVNSESMAPTLYTSGLVFFSVLATACNNYNQQQAIIATNEVGHSKVGFHPGVLMQGARYSVHKNFYSHIHFCLATPIPQIKTPAPGDYYQAMGDNTKVHQCHSMNCQKSSVLKKNPSVSTIFITRSGQWCLLQCILQCFLQLNILIQELPNYFLQGRNS